MTHLTEWRTLADVDWPWLTLTDLTDFDRLADLTYIAEFGFGRLWLNLTDLDWLLLTLTGLLTWHTLLNLADFDLPGLTLADVDQLDWLWHTLLNSADFGILCWLRLSFADFDFFPRIDATDDQIKRAHRQKVLKHHPDKRKHAGEEVIIHFFHAVIYIFEQTLIRLLK